jgi:hypothetical protein
MTFYEWIRDCLWREAARTEQTDPQTRKQVMEGIETWKKSK